MSSFTIVLLLCGVVFLVTGIIAHFFPPVKINWYYGYRTKASMKDQVSWDKAQHLMKRWLFFLAIAYILIALLGFLFTMHEAIGVLLAMAVLIAGVVLLFVKIERALRQSG